MKLEINPLPPHKIRECVIKPLKMASLSNSRLQNRKESPNLSTNNRNMTEGARVCDIYLNVLYGFAT